MEYIKVNYQKTMDDKKGKQHQYFAQLMKVIDNQALYPPESVIEHGKFQQDVGDKANQLYQKYWQLLKANQ